MVTILLTLLSQNSITILYLIQAATYGAASVCPRREDHEALTYCYVVSAPLHALFIQSQQGTPDELRQYVNTLLDAALDSFSASLPKLQRNVDTEVEIQRLSAPCDGI